MLSNIKPRASSYHINRSPTKALTLKSKQKQLVFKEKNAENLYQILQKQKKNGYLISYELIQKIVEIAKIPPHIRKNYESNFLEKALKREKIFWELKWRINKEVFSAIFKELRYEFFAKNQIIENCGDLSKKFYFILEGEILILRPNFLESNNNEPYLKKKEPENEKIAKNYQDCEILHSFIRGHSFGERSLEKNEIRKDIVISKENTSVLWIAGETFRSLIKFQEKLKSQRQIGFFAQIPLFESFPQHVIQMFYRSMQNLTLAKDSIIFQQGDLCDSLYFIQNGEIEIIENIEIYSPLEYIENRDISTFEELEKNSNSMKIADFNTMNSSFQTKNHKKLQKNISISKLSNFQFFGESEVLSNPLLLNLSPLLTQEISPRKDNVKRKEFLTILQNISQITRKSKAKVISLTCELYSISMIMFLDLYLNCCRSLEKLCNITNLRNSWRNIFKLKTKSQVQEKEHILYALSHQNISNKSANPHKSIDKLTHNIYENPIKYSRKSLLEERIKEFMDKSNGFLKESEKNENYALLQKKAKHWGVAPRSKSDEKIVKIANFRIERLEKNLKKEKNQSFSLNLSEILKNPRPFVENRTFVQKQLLYKRLNIDKILEKKQLKEDINSIFKTRVQSSKTSRSNSVKLTSFQQYIQEKQKKY